MEVKNNNDNLVEQNSINISVIVPVYNVEEHLEECLNSIIKQTLRNIEIICVNDGSKDRSGKLLEEYQVKDNRIIIINKENGGLSSARNAGMKIATGEYIGYVDSDDWIDSDFFEKLYTKAKKYSADIAMANMKIFYTNGDKAQDSSYISKIIDKIKPDTIESVDDRKKVIETCVVWNKIFLKKFLENHSFTFYEGLLWEDSPFTTMTVIKANKLCLVRDVYYHWGKHDKSITKIAVYDRKPFDIFEIMSRLKLFFEAENINAMEGYNNFFDELLVNRYNYHFPDLIHGKFKKEFYYRMKGEFYNFKIESVKYLSVKYRKFKWIYKYNYYPFRIIYYIYFKIIYYFYSFYIKIYYRLYALYIVAKKKLINE
jgi:glycosyltransferase involved in cell wall biosynthesis